MDDSVLNSVKSALGLSLDDDAFDSEILLHVNAAIAVLNQNGVKINGTMIASVETLWRSLFKEPIVGATIDEQLMESNESFELIKLYIFLKTKILFDPPAPSVTSYMNESISELLWRLKESYDLPGRVVAYDLDG